MANNETHAHCVAPGCPSSPVRLKKTLCWAHYQRHWRAKRSNAELSVEKELELLRPLTRCAFLGCGRAIHGRGLCSAHYAQHLRGVALTPIGQKKPVKWSLSPDGYLYRVVGGRSILQHRQVMEEKLCRSLVAGENVHHLNGVRDDNRPENLELWSSSQPPGQRVTDKVEWAVNILSLYAPHLLSTAEVTENA